jgi:hypothetical protein
MLIRSDDPVESEENSSFIGFTVKPPSLTLDKGNQKYQHQLFQCQNPQENKQQLDLC